MEEEGDWEEWQDPHGVINPLEAKSHVDTLDQIMVIIQERVDSGNSDELAETTIERVKATLASTLYMMQDADMLTVIKAVKDRSFKVLLLRSDKVDQMLEEILPTEELLRATDVIPAMEAEELLTESDQILMAQLFEVLEVPHEQLTTACSLLGRLLRTLRLS